MLTRYDLLLGRVIEGLFEIGQSELHPVELAGRLNALALERRETHDGRSVAPNRYRIELPKPIFEEMRDLWPSVAEELELALSEHGRAHGFGFLGPLRIEIAPAADQSRIVGQFTDS
jgi:hypothetical protein